MIHKKQILLLVFATTLSIVMISHQSMFMAYASESSPYDSGYDHGCDDAGRSESDKYINQPEKGPPFHTQDFMNGYYAGLNACSSGGSDRDGGFEDQPQPRSSQNEGIDWFEACQVAHTFLGLQTPCNELVNPDNTLTDKGDTVLLCYGGGLLLLLQGGGLGALSADQLGKAAGCPK